MCMQKKFLSCPAQDFGCKAASLSSIPLPSVLDGDAHNTRSADLKKLPTSLRLFTFLAHLKLLEEQREILRSTMQLIDVFAHDVAREICFPLTIVKLYVEFAKKQCGDILASSKKLRSQLDKKVVAKELKQKIANMSDCIEAAKQTVTNANRLVLSLLRQTKWTEVENKKSGALSQHTMSSQCAITPSQHAINQDFLYCSAATSLEEALTNYPFLERV